jgi:hypothetical protein
MPTDYVRVKRLFAELRARLVEWDPIGAVAAGAPEDEYDCVAETVLGMLAEGATYRELASYLNSEFNDYFGVRVQHAREFALAARAWYDRSGAE